MLTHHADRELEMPMKNGLLFFLTFTLLCAAPFVVAQSGSNSEAGSASGIRLQPLPTHLYKTRDPGNENTESWIFWLMVETTAPRDLQVRSARIRLLAGRQPVRSTVYDAEGLRALTIVPPFPPRLMNGSDSPTPIFWPLAIRIRCSEAAAAKVDEMSVELTLDEAERRVLATPPLLVEPFRQKTRLIYPFKGKGIFTNGGVTNGGHRNRSGQFALDGVGLDAGYGVNVDGGGRKSEDYAGWDRAIIAPADGVLVEVRSDRPDQPDPEKSDSQF